MAHQKSMSGLHISEDCEKESMRETAVPQDILSSRYYTKMHEKASNRKERIIFYRCLRGVFDTESGV